MWSNKPRGHFDMRKEERKLFDYLREVSLQGTNEPLHSAATIQFVGTGLERSANASVVSNSIFYKKWFKISREVSLAPSFRAAWNNGKPKFDQPAIEFKHKPSRSLGSSLIISYNGLAVAIMQRYTSTGNLWISSLANFSFQREVLTPIQLSLNARYHPIGSKFAENTIVASSFDCIKLDTRGNPFTHGYASLSAINRYEDNYDFGVSITQATGTGNETSASKAPYVHPLVQLAFAWRYPKEDITVKTNLDFRPRTIKKDYEANVFVEKKLRSINSKVFAFVSFKQRIGTPKWGMGFSVNVDQISP